MIGAPVFPLYPTGHPVLDAFIALTATMWLVAFYSVALIYIKIARGET